MSQFSTAQILWLEISIENWVVKSLPEEQFQFWKLLKNSQQPSYSDSALNKILRTKQYKQNIGSGTLHISMLLFNIILSKKKTKTANFDQNSIWNSGGINDYQAVCYRHNSSSYFEILIVVTHDYSCTTVCFWKE